MSNEELEYWTKDAGESDNDEVKFEMHECGMCEHKFQKVDEHNHKKAALMFISWSLILILVCGKWQLPIRKQESIVLLFLKFSMSELFYRNVWVIIRLSS